ncbi:ABC transporter ATP-binding protein [Sediminispirochaeta smaragdinae]|uniref:ABC transporter ATP-binding protein n=1 Tax=Sediminispirochaeta smaragdinae TaxID=55206 RepID=UPI00031FB324|nr:ABC transporter ATP-binding protein [Sediminispirochaeta smaragdinae]
MVDDVLLRITNLEAGYRLRQGMIRAVDGISLDLMKGEFLGIAGESGCGKSTLAYTLMGLLEDNAEITGGEVLFKGENLLTLSRNRAKEIRWVDISMVFQSAMNALNPVLKISEQLTDTVLTHLPGLTKAKALDMAKKALALVDISEDRLDAYPHQLSGGMKQRVMIAMAMILEPDLIIMDEPTTALDVVVQRTIIDKISDLQKQFNFSVIFITHDLSLLVEISDKLVIMYSGQIVESGPAEAVYRHPAHPYTRGLMNSFPPLSGPLLEFGGIPGRPPNFLDLPEGCRFYPRCPQRKDICRQLPPELLPLDEVHSARCHLLKDGNA